MTLPGALQLLTSVAAACFMTAAYPSDLNSVMHWFQMDELHQTAPDFTFSDAKGRKTLLSSYKGKAILLHFWASWCTPCQKELPDLVALSKQLDGKKWVFLPISVDEPEHHEKAMKFIEGIKSQVPFYQLTDPKAADKYKTWGLPVTYLISPSGEIVARALGRKNWTPNPVAAHDLNELFSSTR